MNGLKSPTPIVEFGIRKTFDGWAATFSIGVQSFQLSEVDTKEEAEWYVQMLVKAFKNLEK